MGGGGLPPTLIVGLAPMLSVYKRVRGGLPTPNPWFSPLGQGAEQQGGVTVRVPRPTAPAPHLPRQQGGVWPLSTPKRGFEGRVRGRNPPTHTHLAPSPAGC